MEWLENIANLCRSQSLKSVLSILSVAILARGLFSGMIHINVHFLKNLIKQFNRDEQFDSNVSLKLIFGAILQSNQVKRTPQDYINELIIWILNLLVVSRMQ